MTSLRSLSRSYIAGLSLLALCGAITCTFQQWHKLADIDKADAAVHVLQPGLKFVEALALERGLYNQVLVSKETGLTNSQALIATRTAATDAIFDKTLRAALRLPPASALQVFEPIRAAWEIVKKARAEADPIWQDPHSTSPDASRSLFSKFIEARGLIDIALGKAALIATEKDTAIGLMIDISRLSNDIREIAGQRSTILSRYVGTLERLNDGDMTKVSELTGAIGVSWNRLKSISDQVEGSLPINKAVAQAQTAFMEQGERAYGDMAKAARDGTLPPMKFLSWRAWTVKMLANSLAARDAPIEQAIERIAERRQSAKESFLLVLAGLGGAVMVIVFAGIAVEVRLVGPLTKLTAAIDIASSSERRAPKIEETKHQTTLTTTFGLREDEIGSLARALGRLEIRVDDIARLNRRFETLLSNIPQGLCFFDDNGVLQVSNEQSARLYGLDPTKIRPGMSLGSISNLRQSLVQNVDGYDCRSIPADSGGGTIPQRVVELRDGSLISVSWALIPQGGWIETHEDITIRSTAERRIAHLAHHDVLTGLANRLQFQDEMARALKRVQRGQQQAIMSLDLDRYKVVNDTLGHACGDELLKQVAGRINDCVRDTDVVARIGGDEFAIIFADEADPGHLTVIAQRTIDRISEAYDLFGHQVHIGASVGIAIAPHDGADAEALLKAADMALYRAKADGRGVYRFFEAEMTAKMQQRHTMETDLRSALASEEFELHYQPILDLKTNEVVGFEALIRWNHPTRGRVPPLDFIPLAEETGLISKIGAWVLKRACVEAMSWPRDLRIAVNLSPRQLGEHRLLPDVTSALAESGLSAGRLELEITEQVMLENSESTLRTLHQLRTLGVRISMDDFGTGYSSLSYLRKFPFDKIKIDQSFIRDLTNDSASMSVIRAVVGLGKGHVMSTTAEGVETLEQLALLRSEGCTEIQGYLLSPPMPGSKVETFLNDYVSKAKLAA